ncbi:Na(+)-translocating NADH-quinone reductase subunit C [bioreactor metagenome]|jgi:Na+-transporting NADH:ubiquinone oxidoreductase subunit C|uniref:Na(+)-translocating NADH-quinone reductase subunit C n=1 Tax=bioreactor metagenome TaxID=1076179 RepID=A0A644WCJ0_9ZZZZ|nr:NADH:ubiquinone reductase (Na(+)-transporting) subunit C [Paludibacter sp.]
MNTNKNSYTLIYATVMVIVVALMLALVSSSLKGIQTANVELDKKKQILSSLNVDFEGQDAAALYDKYIVKELVINTKAEVLSEIKGDAFKLDYIKELAKPLEERSLPLYIAEVDGKTKYIIPLRGAGLWGPIWGYIALNDDKNMVYGTFFSHASETPGLGAEIAQANFQQEFVGKRILNDKNEFVSIAVMKSGQIAENQDQIDAISGGTITSKGVEMMLLSCIGQYEAYLKNSNGGTEQ